MRKLLLALVALALSLPAAAQWGGIYNSKPQNTAGSTSITTLGTITTGTWNGTDIQFANIQQVATNTIVGNATSGTADLAAQAMPSCSTSGSALKWTTNTGFGCNTSIDAATLGGATFAAPGAIGGGTPAAGSFTTLNASGVAAVGVGGTGALNASIDVNGSSADDQGARIRFLRNSVAKGYIGMASQILGGSSSSLVLSSPSDSVAIYSQATLTSTFATTGVTVPIAVTMSGLTAAAGTPNSICQNNATKEITVNAALTCTVSSARFKNTIRPFDGEGLRMVTAMQPDTFFYNDRNRPRIGLVAEDLANIDPRLAEWDDKGRPNSIDFPAMMAVLVKAVQEQQQQIDALKNELTRARGFIPVTVH